jgi:hypothetical protein
MSDTLQFVVIARKKSLTGDERQTKVCRTLAFVGVALRGHPLFGRFNFRNVSRATRRGGHGVPPLQFISLLAILLISLSHQTCPLR